MNLESKPLVLIIEDERQIRRIVRTALEEMRIDVAEAGTAKQGLVEVGARIPDLLILDLGLPDMDGVEVIRNVRNFSDIPIIVLSARTQEREKVAALDAGADDYLTKPFGVSELQARLRAHLRRRSSSSGNIVHEYVFGQIVVDVQKRVVTRSGVEIHLTPLEYKLLLALLKEAGKVITHFQLLKDVWGTAHDDHEHYVRVYMGHLRSKVELNAANPENLLTEVGVGYRIVGVETR